MSWTLAIAPLIPMALLAMLATAGAALVIFGIARRARGVWVRALCLVAFVALLANPSLVQEDRDSIPDIAILAVDQSASQDIGARNEITAEARRVIESRIEAMTGVDLRVVDVAADRAGGGADGTRAFGDLSRALSDVPPERLAGVIMLTDGQIHDVPDNVERLGFEAPVHVFLTGAPNEGDRILTVTQAPVFGIVGNEVTLTVRVDDHGADNRDGVPVQLQVRIDGEDIATETAQVGADHQITVPITHGGENVIEVEVEPGPEELTLANNRAVITPNGVRDRLRVLLVTGEPHPGERTWRDLLKSDPSVDLVHFTILRPPEKQDGTPIEELSLIAFPTRELFSERLYEFDLIIFDRYRRRSVLHPSYLANIASYVEQGGALLTASGPSFASYLSLYRTPLAGVLPAQPTGDVTDAPFRAEVTTRGQRHPVTTALPGANNGDDAPGWGRWFRIINAETVSGETVMSDEAGDPLLVLDRVGEGRVAQLLSDQAWLWTRGFEGGGPQAELLRRLAHWLMREPELDEEVLSGEVQGEEMRITRRTMADSAAPITVTRPNGVEETIELDMSEPGIFTAALPARELGLYRLNDGALTSVVASGVLNALEYSDVRVSAEPTEQIVDASGGGTFWLGDTERPELPTLRRTRAGRAATGLQWAGLVRNEQFTVRAVREVPLIPAILALLLIGGALLGSWWREGR